MRNKLSLRILFELLFAFAGGAAVAWSIKPPPDGKSHANPSNPFLPSPPETYWYKYIDLSGTGRLRRLDLMRNPPPGSDILDFALGSTNRVEQELALRAIVVTDREKSIPLLKYWATNPPAGAISPDVRADGVYRGSIFPCILHPQSFPGWNPETTERFLDYCRWAVDNEREPAGQAGADFVLLEFDSAWRTSDRRRDALLRKFSATDVRPFSGSAADFKESSASLGTVVETHLDRTIPLLVELATNGLVDAKTRRSDIYGVILSCLRQPSRISGWTEETAEAFLSFAKWAVDNDTDRWCQNDAHWICWKFVPGWATSLHRRSVLLRWLAEAETDSEKESVRTQLDEMGGLATDSRNHWETGAAHE